MITSADELGTDAPADDSNEEWESSSKTTLNDVEASLLLQMKSTTKNCHSVTQSVDDSAGASVPISTTDVTMLQHIVSACTIGFITLLCSQLTWTFPFHKTPFNHQPGRCRLVPGIDTGCQDIQVLPNGLAFITSGVEAQSRGEILLFDFKKPRHGAHALDIVGDLDRSTFSPIGLSIWRDCNFNVIYIFVGNTRGYRKDTVEKFRYDESRRQLHHLRTYRDPTFRHPSDISATGEDSFYFTNCFKLDFTVEFIRRLTVGNVGFYDGRRGHILLVRQNIPISINSSPDYKNVFISELGGKRLTVYTRESDNSLTSTQVVPLGTFAGKINVDVVSGHLWMTGHPDGQSLVNHLKPPHTVRTPSQVLRLTLSEDSKVTEIAEVYYNDGRQISLASTAVHYRRYMLVGSVFTKLLLCKLATDSSACDGSACDGGACDGSACDGRVCDGSACDGSACDGSACDSSACDSSACDGSACDGSACDSSACDSSACDVSACDGSACDGSACDVSACDVSACDSSACDSSECDGSACDGSACDSSACDSSACDVSACDVSACDSSACDGSVIEMTASIQQTYELMLTGNIALNSTRLHLV
ncbi:Serum paraoxonase/arylesterase 2 [Lamellibrachia satsuma]|nr:Serum paraoxonase/arylesterase 2 [Lamellibrachia satsuma]